ncbi:MAG: DUF4276 family protein [Candidatus Parabeggiatoa sp.]|nr:DUF4276 family protein [Candidatus Parabeggiatoa sp.]
MHIEFLVEELSMEMTLDILVPKIIGPQHTFDIHNFQGKKKLLKRLPKRMQAYANFMPDDWRIVVLVDRDNDDCKQLKQELCTASRVVIKKKGNVVLHRIAIEELEAWFLGDIPAIRIEFPKVPAKLDKQQKFRDPDAIKGGTWETLDKLLKDHGYQTLFKTQLAQQVAPNMTIENNRSSSFKHFRDGLIRIVNQGKGSIC